MIGMGGENVYLGVTAMQDAVRPRCIWLTLEPSDVIELRQVVLDHDVPGAEAFFRRVVMPQLRQKGYDATQRRATTSQRAPL